MSGGSYEYLFTKDVEDLFNREDTIQEMADRLADLGYAKDAAAETQGLLMNMRQFRNRIDVSLERLREVWRAVEWVDSGDSREDHIKEALKAYRKEK